jgi:hypothetical protein
MGYDLTNDEGDYFRFNISGWSPMLALAEKYGWKPGKTLHERDKRWNGTYYSNDGQRVTAKDAVAIADALEKALPNLGDKMRSPYTISFRNEMPDLNDKSEYASARRHMGIPETVSDDDIIIKKYGHGDGEWYPGKEEQAPYTLVVIGDDSEDFYEDERNADPECRWSGESGIKRVKEFIEFCRKGSFRIY